MPCERKELAEHLLKDERVSVRRAYRVTGATRSMFYYRSQRDDTEVREKLGSLTASHPNRGFDCYYGRIRAQGLGWNRKRVLRLPKRIRVDNGPEFISHAFMQWYAAKGVEVHHIQSGKSARNAYIERFNRTFREVSLTHTPSMTSSICDSCPNNGVRGGYPQ